MNSRVMATVDGQPITMDDVLAFIQALGPQGAQYNNEPGFQMIVDQLVSQKLLYLDAAKSGLAFEKEFKEQLEVVKRDLLASYAINKVFSSVKVTKAECNEEYLKEPSKYSDPETVAASHILVDNEDKAKEIFEKLNAGDTTFEDAAKEFSSCPSSKSGGSLGEFAKGSMVPEFEQAAFSMEVDKISEPVKTQFGYHLIKVTAKKDAKVKSFEEAEAAIREELIEKGRQTALNSKVNQLKIVHQVDYVNATSGILI